MTNGPKPAPNGHAGPAVRLPGRPRSKQADRAILDAARDLLGEEGFTPGSYTHLTLPTTI
jgi:hypothetical protein